MKSEDLAPSPESAKDTLTSQEFGFEPNQCESPSGSSWWDPQKKKAYRIAEGCSQECDNFVIQEGQIYVHWPSGEMTATNYPAEYLEDNQIRRISFKARPAMGLEDPAAGSDEDERIVVKKKPAIRASSSKVPKTQRPPPKTRNSSTQKAKRLQKTRKASSTQKVPTAPKAKCSQKTLKASSIHNSQLGENSNPGEYSNYTLMYYKNSNKHAIRRKKGKQLFQHSSLEVVQEGLAKLQSGSSEAEVIAWSKSV